MRSNRIVGVPTKSLAGFYLREICFSDKGKSPDFFSTPHPSTQDQGGARKVLRGIVGVPTILSNFNSSRVSLEKR
ncbi:hypothetical protein CH380_03660 [Leptospira adleri]|uniref:Uncharacterized protein n=1 Tax=Leptospira adleri TaxID=2023186 RepID=A0A2M9YTF4_9LEPT|nr:hypothetical protein CH380_03660 [Leptospira adleri]